MTPTQVRHAEKLLVRLALIKTIREQLREASDMRLSITRSLAGSPSMSSLDLDRPAVADLLDREADECRRALTDLGVDLGAGS